MRRRLALIITALVLPAASAQEPELTVEVDRQQIYLGESIIYDVTVNHVDNPEAPSLDAFTDFTIESLGKQSQNSQRITSINGRTTREIRRGMLFRFRLTPQQAGEQTIPAPTATVNGNQLTGREVSIRVVAPEEQDIVILKSSVDRNSVYPLQPFTLTLQILIKGLPEPVSDRSPLSVQQGAPVQLTASWLDDDQVPAGLNPQTPWQQLLEPLLSRRGDGMSINNIGQQSVFSLFGQERTSTFLPNVKHVMLPDKDGNDTDYWQYTLQRTFLAERVGEYRFSPANMKGMFGTSIVSDRLQGEDIFAVSNSVDVTVNDVPTQGRPATFNGGVGTFQITADIAPRSASVGDPMTLTVTMHGEGTTADLRPPDLSIMPQFAESFRAYDATEETVGNGRVFTYSVRPLTTEVTQLPPIEVSYFDVNDEKYVTIATDAVPLQISAAQQLENSDIVAVPASAESSGRSLQTNDSGLFANHSDVQDIRSHGIVLTRWMTAWGCMIAGYAVIGLGLRKRQQLHSDPALRRRRNAGSRALEALKTVKVAAADASAISPDALSRIVAGLIADVTGAAEAGMTPQDAASILEDIGLSTQLRIDVVNFMSHCDDARFGGNSVNGQQLLSTCETLIAELSRELPKLSRPNSLAQTPP